MARRRRSENGYTPRHAAAPLSAAAAALFTARLVITGLAMAVCTTMLSLFTWTVLPYLAGWSPSVVLTGSMLPAIAPGDIVVTGKLDPAALKAGHVIRFVDPSRPERSLLHRIVRINDDGTFVTRGDANGSEDSTAVPAANITGMARLRVPLVGLPVVWLRQGEYLPLGLTGAGAIAVLQVLSGLRDTFRGTADDARAGHATAGAGPDPDDPAVPDADAPVRPGPEADPADEAAAPDEADAVRIGIVHEQAGQLVDVAVRAAELRTSAASVPEAGAGSVAGAELVRADV